MGYEDAAVCKRLSPEVFQFEGLLSIRDKKKYFQFPFEVKKGVTKIIAKLLYNKEPGNILYLQLHDYRRFRGIGKPIPNQRKNHLEIMLTPFAASNGGIFGKLPGGRWLAEIDCADIIKLCKYQLIVEVYYEPIAYKGTGAKGIKLKEDILCKEKKWYRGDLHIHSIESDGTESVQSIMQRAKQAQLDFIAITDHNTNSGWQYIRRSKDLLFLPSIEISTYDGHANAIGVEDWIDWRLGFRNRCIQDIIDDTHKQQGLFIINHPKSIDMKGRISWLIEEVDYRQVDAIEIWNAPWYIKGNVGNILARALWTELLNQGYKIAGVAGSDLHTFDHHDKRLGRILNYVYSEKLSQNALLRAIKEGRLFLTLGPKLHLCAIYKGKEFMIGDTICQEDVQTIQFYVSGEGIAKNTELRIMKNGNIIYTMEIINEDNIDFSFENLIEGDSWYRAELHHKRKMEEVDSLLAITNPIYIKK
ncbi:MAG: CehA/McbA family metallohydrolase [Bacillota bacterium]